MASPQLRVGDVGTTIRLTIKEAGSPLDISTATVKTFKLRKPSGVVVALPASFTGTGSDGKLEYVTATADIDASGPWMGQAYIEMGALKFHTTPFSFQVGENLS